MKTDMVIDKIRNTIIKNELISRGDKVIIGLSGGADSVCLTHALWSLCEEFELQITAVHINHNIRGKDAVLDADFAREFSKKLGILFEQKSVQVKDYACKMRMSEEEAGREIRYAVFQEVMERQGYNKIATAHNRNDSAETILMNFMRGSALKGLLGIPCRRGNIIRPLIDVTRAEIEEYCRQNGLDYVTDKTNLEDSYTRNKIRHRLLPMIEKKFNPNFINTAAKNAAVIKSDEDYLDLSAEKKYNELVKDNAASIDGLLNCHEAISRRVVRKMIADVIGIGDVSSDFADKVITLAKKGKSGTAIDLPKGALARIEYGRLIIEKAAEYGEYEYPLPIGKDIYIKEYGVTIRAEFAKNKINDKAVYFSGIDTDTLYVRNRRNGDFFCPEGMSGRKKLKDYFIDEKISRPVRGALPLIVAGDDIIYITGHRADRRFAFCGEGIKIIVK